VLSHRVVYDLARFDIACFYKQYRGLANNYSQKSVGLDPRMGLLTGMYHLVDGLVNVLHIEDYQRPDFNRMITTRVKLFDDYNTRFDSRYRIIVDDANPFLH
jgi:hypothetical protein